MVTKKSADSCVKWTCLWSILDMDLIYLTHTCDTLSITNLGNWIFSAGEYWLFNWTFSSLGPLMESPVCLPVSICLLTTLAFTITLELSEKVTSYLAYILHQWPSPYNWLFGLHCHLGHSISQIHLVHNKFGLNVVNLLNFQYSFNVLISCV